MIHPAAPGGAAKLVENAEVLLQAGLAVFLADFLEGEGSLTYACLSSLVVDCSDFLVAECCESFRIESASFDSVEVVLTSHLFHSIFFTFLFYIYYTIYFLIFQFFVTQGQGLRSEALFFNPFPFLTYILYN